MVLNGIYPINIYPYNIQIKKKSSVDKVNPEAEQKQQPQDTADLNRQKSSTQQINPPAETVNISRVIADFKNTLAAIGASKEVNEEVQAYLKLVELQSAKDVPSPRIIKSNLNNAASILDKYISETLNKPSKVVKDWVDTLLMQRIEYKSDNPVEAVKEMSTAPVEVPVAKVQPEKTVDPKDIKLEKLYMNKASVLDENGDVVSALKFYNKAANMAIRTGNQALQANAHYNMASIYDDCGKTDAALEHYYQSIALDGQVENLKGQSLALNDTGNIYSAQRDYRQALDHFQVGFGLTKETKDKEGAACILSNTAGVFRDLGDDEKALKYYRNSIKLDIETGNIEGYAKSYELAGDVMLRNNQLQKAESLYQKSLIAAQKIGDTGWSSRIIEKIQQNNFGY